MVYSPNVYILFHPQPSPSLYYVSGSRAFKNLKPIVIGKMLTQGLQVLNTGAAKKSAGRTAGEAAFVWGGGGRFADVSG